MIRADQNNGTLICLDINAMPVFDPILIDAAVADDDKRISEKCF